MINLDKSNEKEMYDQLVSLVDQMLITQKEFNITFSESDKKILKQKIDLIDEQIDQIVYKLYGLTDEDIKIIECDK